MNADSSSSVLVSEEMLTVTAGVDWLTKLENLSRYLKRFDDFEIVVSIRDPLKASFSYYVERYEVISQKGKVEFFDAVRNSAHLKIYHYEMFFSILNSLFGEGKIKLIRFEDIFNYSLTTSALHGIFGMEIIEPFPKDNETKAEEGFKMSTKGSKVRIPTVDEFESAKSLLDYDFWRTI